MRHKPSEPEHRGGALRQGLFGDGDGRHERRHHERHNDERGEHEHRGHGHHRGRRSGRLFDHGELRLVVLALISERPRHGYEIIKEIEDRVAGTYTPSPGVIYPTLTLLEELGHATVAESEAKKRYAITTEGTAYLAVNQAALDRALQRMQSVSTAHGGGPAPEIMRARENLKLALRLREARGPLTEQQVRAIAAALDAAAIAVERS
jgi:DNA-binding PadR family transcriptional regulator